MERSSAARSPAKYGLLAMLACAVFALGYSAGFWRAGYKVNGASVATASAGSVELAGTANQASEMSAPAVAVFKGFVRAKQKVSVSSDVSGRLRKLLVKEGERVELGQVLAMLDDRDARGQLELARARVAQAIAEANAVQEGVLKAQLDSRRVHELASRGMVSAATVSDADHKLRARQIEFEAARALVKVQEESLKLAQVALEKTLIRAPLAGVVIEISAGPGEIVAPLSAVGSNTRSGICTIVDMTELEIVIDVPERLITRVEAGQKAEAVVDAFPDQPLKARVIAVGSAAMRGAGTIPVRVMILDLHSRLLPDMSASVTLFVRGS